MARVLASAELPSALEHWAEIERQLDAPNVAAFFDYDGTLTPIAPRPELAVLSPEVRSLLSALAKTMPVAVVTGRSLSDVKQLVGLDQLYYAGNHGFEIEGPDVSHREAPGLRTTFDTLARQLQPTVDATPGSSLEAKGFSVAVHYRQTDDAHVPALRDAVEQAVDGHDEVRLGHGKKVFELRPTLDWHKGAAVRWLVEHLGNDDSLPKPLFIGDDRTDEDALAYVRDLGVGVFVGTPGWDTAAHYGLRDTDEVKTLLIRLLGTRAGA